MKYRVGGLVLDVIFSGEAARICGCDRRTFTSWAKKEGVLPIAKPNGRALYERKDVERVAKKMKSEKLAAKV